MEFLKRWKQKQAAEESRRRDEREQNLQKYAALIRRAVADGDLAASADTGLQRLCGLLEFSPATAEEHVGAVRELIVLELEDATRGVTAAESAAADANAAVECFHGETAETVARLKGRGQTGKLNAGESAELVRELGQIPYRRGEEAKPLLRAQEQAAGALERALWVVKRIEQLRGSYAWLFEEAAVTA